MKLYVTITIGLVRNKINNIILTYQVVPLGLRLYILSYNYSYYNL